MPAEMFRKRVLMCSIAAFAAVSACETRNTDTLSLKVEQAGLPIELPTALEKERNWYAAEIAGALNDVAEFFAASGLEAPETDFVRNANIFESTLEAREALAARFNVPIASISATFSGAVSDETLYIVSRTAYEQNWRSLYPQWEWTDDAYRGLIAHELFHAAHERLAIAKYGTADAMGPSWFFEGLAVVAAHQFVSNESLLTRDELESLVGGGRSPNVSYPLYGRIVRSLAHLYGFERLVAEAGASNFPESLLAVSETQP